MARLADYDQFEGLYWDTGSVRNHLAYRGFVAPHTGKPYSEALLMGVSGGAVMGYFSFAYEGHDPHVAILTRNTFDPLETMLSRLGVVQSVQQTGSAAKGLANLVESLEEGLPPLVWADMFSLPYNTLPADDSMWSMEPIVVYGYDEAADRVWVADRARVPLTLTTQELAAARGRVKKTKHRILTLEPPNPEKLTGAVQMGIWDCIKLFTEAPPKGARHNFGLAAFRFWADLLVKPKMRLSWAKIFPPGPKMYAGLTSAFDRIALFGKDGGADRDVYAVFLEEAAQILAKPALSEVAAQFRRSAAAWDELGEALLPDEEPLLGETRQLMVRKHRSFLDQGNAGLEEIRQINTRLSEIKTNVAVEFPLTEAGVKAQCENLRAKILAICEIEEAAIDQMKEIMA